MAAQTANIKRYFPDTEFGLSTAQIKKRIAEGLINQDTSIPVKTTADIIKNNIFTLFNFINLVLAVAILWVGSYRNLMFMGVVICNAFIGIAQEIRAKKAVDKLNLISSSQATVIRNGKKGKLKIERVVLDDVICYQAGEQIISDSIIKRGTCEVNESLLTGEPDLIAKKEGDMLLSGSYVVNGSCTAVVEHVSKDNYASKILKGSKFIKKTKSEIMTTINKIIKIISIAIIPIGVLLFYRQFSAASQDFESAIISTAAALTGMIPEGLVLLASSVLAVGVMRLSRHKVLVQDLYCLETLARVDTLCLDKTGTLTEGTFELEKTVPQNGFSEQDVHKALTMLTGVINDNNETFRAIQKKFLPEKNKTPETIIPFSSEKKWSGAYFTNEGSFIIGAAEIIFGDEYKTINEKIKHYTESYRVLALAHSEETFRDGSLPKGIQLMAFLLIKDKIRYNAERTLEFFKKQDVDIKIISGDNPLTVSKIAQRVNLKNYDSFIDVSTLKSKEAIEKAALRYTIFGRVTPSQKQEIIRAIKCAGHTTAMVGDGINDVLAMKESDCAVAMASGSDVVRNVAHLVLLNSDFSSMPKAVSEGRKSINNIQRSSSLFVVKTIYSFLLSVLFFFIPAPYPFIPIQMTLISSLTIGIPSFILALEPNRHKVKGNLFNSMISTSLPAALTIVFSILTCVGIYSLFNVPDARYYTLTVILTGFIGILLLHKISTPLTKLRKLLIWAVCIGFAIGILRFYSLFEIEPLNWINFLILVPLIILAKIAYTYVEKIKIENLLKKA